MGGEDAAVDAAEDEHRGGQRPLAVPDGLEQPEDGSVRHHAVDDHGVARRDQDAEGAARGGDGGGVILAVARADHPGYHDAADGRSGGGAGATQGRKDHAGEDGDHRQPTAQVAHGLLRHFDDFACDSGRLHEEARHDEADGGDERELVHAGIEVLGDELHREGHADHGDDGRQPDDAEQRHPKEHEKDERDDEQHGSILPALEVERAVADVAQKPLKHAEDGQRHADGDDEVGVHHVDFKRGGNLLEAGHVFEHPDAVVENEDAKAREGKLGNDVAGLDQPRKTLFQQIHEHEDAQLLLVLHGDGHAQIGGPDEQVAAQLLDPRKGLAEQEAREDLGPEQQDQQGKHDRDGELLAPSVNPLQALHKTSRGKGGRKSPPAGWALLLGEHDVHDRLALFGAAVADDFIALGPRGPAKAYPLGQVFNHAEQFHAVLLHQLVVRLKHFGDLGTFVEHGFLARADEGLARLFGKASVVTPDSSIEPPVKEPFGDQKGFQFFSRRHCSTASSKALPYGA